MLDKLKRTPLAKSPAAFVRGWRSFVALAVNQPGMMAVYICAALVNVGSGISALFFVSRILQGIYTALAHPGTIAPSKIYMSLLFSVIFGLLEQLTYKVMSIAERRSYFRYTAQLEEAYNSKIANLDAAYFEDQQFYARLSRVSGEVSWKPANHAYQTLQVVQATLRAIVPAIILLQFAPWMIPFILIGSIPSLLAEYKLSKVSWGIWQADSKKAIIHSKLSWLLRSQDSILEVRMLGVQSFLTTRIRELLESIAHKQDKLVKRASIWLVSSRILELLVSFLLQLWILHKVVSRAPGFTIGTFTFYSGMVGQFSNAIGLLSAATTEFLEYDLFMKDYYQIMDTKNTVIDPSKPTPIANTFSTITFEHVSFSYKGNRKKALDDVTFTLHRGDKLAIVGVNGAGKSTLIKLLLRFYYPSSGRILVDGVDIRDIAIQDLYQQIGALFQTFNHYPLNVQTNINIGRIDDDAHDWKKAARMADASELIAQLPRKEKTVLDISLEDGIDLSGGQWQRIALARAFYRNAELLILDEPTAAVDAKAEYEIFENIRKNQANKTTIIISHRFSTVRNADRIIVLDAGKIVEMGTHEELVDVQGIYHDMFTKQAAGYR